MASIAKDITWLIGRTPLIEISGFPIGEGVRLLAKLESFNPTSSNKDRAALGMIEDAERKGFLSEGGTIVECTSGDTGVALAMVAACRGYRLILTMPKCMAESRCNLIRALGAEIEATENDDGIRGAMARAEALAKEIPGAVVLQPFSNRANADAHAETTAREIWADTDGQVSAVVCPVGTGGVAAGCAAFLKPKGVSVFGVEPAESAVLSGASPGRHDIPGMGAGFLPDILQRDALAGVVAVPQADAFRRVRELAQNEAILAGPASGAVLHAALELARGSKPGSILVAVLPDSGERYEEHQAYHAGGVS